MHLLWLCVQGLEQDKFVGSSLPVRKMLIWSHRLILRLANLFFHVVNSCLMSHGKSTESNVDITGGTVMLSPLLLSTQTGTMCGSVVFSCWGFCGL
jgi:hypothetical protein